MSSETKAHQAETSPLLSLPPELFLMIANQLDAEYRATLFACSRSLAQTYVPIQATYIDHSGESLLTGAILMGFHGLAHALLMYGADPNLADPFNKHTPLHHAVTQEDLVATRLLLEFGADINLADGDQWLPLHHAAENGSTQIIELLADAGASMDAGMKCTPLELASVWGHIDAVRMLLSKGADPNMVAPMRPNPPLAPIYFAANEGHAEIAALLVEAGATRDLVETMLVVCDLGRTAVVKAMVETGKEEVWKIARVVLLQAMEEAEESRERMETTQVLLDAGIVVDKTTLSACALGGTYRKHDEMLRRYDADLAAPSLQ